jgi:4-hydroxy-tetrahydrodipicolinate reductase
MLHPDGKPAMNILLSGASGRVGREIDSLVEADPALQITGRASAGRFFHDTDRGDVIIDFSRPELTSRSLDFAVRNQVPLVVGTTGIEPALQARIESASASIPICQAANFSIGVNVLLELAARAATALPASFEAEIFELHHRWKIDAPSGTALALGRAVAQARGLDEDAGCVRSAGERRSGEIGYQVARGGDVVGEHLLMLLGDGERIELAHRACDRSVFARGALHAATRLLDREPGSYSFRDLLS